MTRYLYGFFDENMNLKYLIKIEKLNDDYRLFIETRSSFRIENVKVNTNLDTFIKDIAKLSDIHYYMSYANIFNKNYILNMMMIRMKNFTFEPFSSEIKNYEQEISVKFVYSSLYDKTVTVYEDPYIVSISGKMYPHKIIYGFSLVHFDLKDSNITPSCIGHCFAYELNQKTNIELYMISGSKVKWTCNNDIKTALVEFKEELSKLGCTHVIPGNFYYISNNTNFDKRERMVVSLKSYLVDSNYIKYLISSIEAEMMHNLDVRISEYAYLVVKTFTNAFPHSLQIIVRINEIDMNMQNKSDKTVFNFTLIEEGKQISLFTCAEYEKIKIFPKISPFKFGNCPFKFLETEKNENMEMLLDVYNNSKLKKCECKTDHDIVGIVVIDLKSLIKEELQSFISANYHFIQHNNHFETPFSRESKIDINYRNVCKSLIECKNRFISRFPHIFNEAGYPKLDCYLPGMKSGFRRIFDIKMNYSKRLTVRYSDAGILATRMFLMCIPTDFKEAINIDMKHDLQMKTAFPVFVGNSLIPGGSVCYEILQRDAFIFLDDMPKLWKILYSTFFHKFIFISHAWLCAIITLDQKSESFAEFIADYELYIGLIRKLIEYYVKVYPGE